MSNERDNEHLHRGDKIRYRLDPVLPCRTSSGAVVWYQVMTQIAEAGKDKGVSRTKIGEGSSIFGLAHPKSRKGFLGTGRKRACHVSAEFVNVKVITP